MKVATTGDVDFESMPHVRRCVLGGITAKNPLTFAYCYYQYAKRIMKELLEGKYISKKIAKQYLAWWMLLMLRGLVVVYQPSDTREEKDTKRIHGRLKVPILVYFICEYIKYRVWPSTEMRALIYIYLKIKILKL